MEWNFMFFLNSILLGLGLSMDAFSVSMANGLNEPNMKKQKMYGMTSLFAGFQALMPLIGWVLVHTIVQYFKVFENFIPWIVLILLVFIGGKMLIEGIKNKNSNEESKAIGILGLIMQGIATSIDALSVGFTISHYGWIMALVCALIIAVVTFVLCLVGVLIGKKFGNKLSSKAQILGGLILIGIGLEIFITGII